MHPKHQEKTNQSRRRYICRNAVLPHRPPMFEIKKHCISLCDPYDRSDDILTNAISPGSSPRICEEIDHYLIQRNLKARSQ